MLSEVGDTATSILSGLKVYDLGTNKCKGESIWDRMMVHVCHHFPLCKIIGKITGTDPSRDSSEEHPERKYKHSPAGLTVHNIRHLGQLVEKNYRGPVFRKYNHGHSIDNYREYGTWTPPAYDVTLLEG